MKPIAVFWLLFFSHLALSQTRTVLDHRSHSPVAYATVKVLHQKNGTITSEHGRFDLELNKTDTLLISSVGYQTKIVTAGEAGNIIYLERKAAILNDVVVTNRKPPGTLRLGYGGSIPKQTINWGPSENKEEFAQKIELPDPLNSYRLRKIYLPVKTLSCAGTLLLSIYEEDTISGYPGEAIFAKPIKAGTRKNILTVDLTTENIIINGSRLFYISLGWLPGAPKQNCITTILMRTSTDTSTFSRTLTSPTFQWHKFGRLKGPDSIPRQWNTMYAVEVEEMR